MELTNKQRIGNVLNEWDKQPNSIQMQWRFAGYMEALLQNEGVIGLGEDLPYKTIIVTRWLFGKCRYKETYPELMYRLANEYLMKTGD